MDGVPSSEPRGRTLREEHDRRDADDTPATHRRVAAAASAAAASGARARLVVSRARCGRRDSPPRDQPPHSLRSGLGWRGRAARRRPLSAPRTPLEDHRSAPLGSRRSTTPMPAPATKTPSASARAHYYPTTNESEEQRTMPRVPARGMPTSAHVQSGLPRTADDAACTRTRHAHIRSRSRARSRPAPSRHAGRPRSRTGRREGPTTGTGHRYMRSAKRGGSRGGCPA